MTSLIYELVQVSPVASKTRDYYQLSIRDNVTGIVTKVTLLNPDIRKYCKANNISLKTYENMYNYNDIQFEEYKDLMGIIDEYVAMDNYHFKKIEID